MPHPYEKYQSMRLWTCVDKTIAKLERNGDIDLKTPREYVIGYLCQELIAQRQQFLEENGKKKNP